MCRLLCYTKRKGHLSLSHPFRFTPHLFYQPMQYHDALLAAAGSTDRKKSCLEKCFMKRLLEKHHIVKSIATRNVLFVCLSLSQTTPHDIKPKTSLLVRFLQQSDWQKLLCTPRKAVAPLPPPTPVVGLASVSRYVVVTSHERCDGRQTGRMVVDWMY